MTGHNSDRATCPVQRSQQNKTAIYVLSAGRVIIQTVGEDLTLICAGKGQRKTSIQFGLYEIMVPTACTLKGNDWLVYGELMTSINITAEFRRIRLPTFNLSWMEELDIPPTNQMMDMPFLEPIGIPDPENDLLQEENSGIDNNYDIYNESLVSHGLSWTAIGLIIAILILVAVVGRYVYLRWENINFYFRRSKKQIRGTDQPIVPLQSTSPEDIEK